ncbi:unnamed protein product [Cercopithifilaria johnstoni]|uniref:Coenzyme Q-binding protein COQ10 START domain-containing protein n=1 Tax=Cercopithifilaria johnstoni TaxID=2874296 RepID=A0A8J2QB59_9BILA|nr:unnamed protein product [Cercopithifilaria johnstoni]
MILKGACFNPRRNLFVSLKQLTNLKEYQEKRIVGYTAEEMFDIAANVSEYPEFVPWCQSASVKANITIDLNKARYIHGLQHSSSRHINHLLYFLFQRLTYLQKHSPNLFTAQLQIGFPPVCETYTSRISTTKPSMVRVSY